MKYIPAIIFIDTKICIRSHADAAAVVAHKMRAIYYSTLCARSAHLHASCTPYILCTIRYVFRVNALTNERTPHNCVMRPRVRVLPKSRSQFGK